jgi:hypothetical protein
MSEKKTSLRTFRIVVFTLGTLIALLFLLAFVPKLISELLGDSPQIQSGREWEGHVMTAMFLTFIVGYSIGWWRILWGGIIILLAAFIVTIPFIILQNNYGSLIFGIPQLVIGLLFLLLYWFEKREDIPKI